MNKIILVFSTFLVLHGSIKGQQKMSANEFEIFSIQKNDSLNLLVSQKKYKEAIQLTDNWLSVYDNLAINIKKKFYSILGSLHYNNACMYSLLKNKEKALTEFDKAIQTGYKNYGHIKTDTDLDFIRKEKRFVEIMEVLKQKYDYLIILKQAKEYNYHDKQEITIFTYKSQSDSNLMSIRKKFNLDSIAGKGNEISQILNILHWVHFRFPHDGSKEVPKFNTTYEMMIDRINQQGTLHCGALATILEDCYLAMGFPARRVVCLPKDSTDYDSHSINTVFSVSLNKWIWVDPTNDAYMMDENGVLLGVSEVRERLIEGKPLIVNPEANWNRKSSVNKEDYLHNYMAKNLYIIQCFVTNGGQSRSNVLLPVVLKSGYSKISVNKPKYTYNPDLFWAKPGN